jgi:hypothetical protein
MPDRPSAQTRRRTAAIATAALGVSAVALALVWSTRDDERADERQVPRFRAAAASVPAASSATLPPSLPASASARGPAATGDDYVLSSPNLYAKFQLAIGSNDPTVLGSALNAWRTCAGYVGLGTWDLDTWLNMVMPPGLPVDERERRAQHARAVAARCAGFADQTDAHGQAEDMTKKALALGVTSEQLRQALRDHVQSHGESPQTTVLSCAVVSEYPRDQGAIRLISPAMRGAARARSSHVLNSTPQPALNLAVNLAFCDLDPDGCDAHSNIVGSACVQAGACEYAREEDYWRDTTPPEIFAQAQSLREAIVQLVRDKQCRELFE